MGQKWLFDTGTGLTCKSLKALTQIDKKNRPSKINATGTGLVELVEVPLSLKG
jgi:hypothetical protein